MDKIIQGSQVLVTVELVDLMTMLSVLDSHTDDMEVNLNYWTDDEIEQKELLQDVENYRQIFDKYKNLG